VSPEASKKTLALADFAEFLADLSRAGFESVVIGGCAVGAYAELRGETVLSGDLDLYTTSETLRRIMDWAAARNIRIVKRPQPRALAVAFLEWEGKEVNVLIETNGLPPPDVALRLAREFQLTKKGNLSVLVVDPFDLLTNKLKVNRPKDQPHQAILRRFIEDEVVAAFREETDPRARIAPARRYLEATGSEQLPEAVAARLLELSGPASDLRFLMHHAPTPEIEEGILRKAPDDPVLCRELETIRSRNRS
jgi:hypothetical protein